ncbi:DivIVA domain-containing protein [Allocatelliglobosispora scoriae]|uniref:DivIVA domain-containing protein n=1 Tax=Allocatelliglobosispora scoriae TaxID=643052 RepID=A0A841BTF4_9ACTN|nr:DivIVA domain-containing protein [Allocatelliglobosispora scoriae]MBB5871484.1 DivIVA domain-containing protein [Allocatelliglobosispora scoriae]
MAQLLLLLVVALTVGAVVFGVMVLVGGSDPGLRGVEPDGRSVPLPGSRPLVESDVVQTTFDSASGFFVARGYRMAQVDQALRRVAYDIGYKDELIGVLSAEVEALREGRLDDADALRTARLSALGEATPAEPGDELPLDRGAAAPVIDLGEVAAAPTAEAEPVEVQEPDTSVPDGPFAPWPAEAKADDEADHPADTEADPAVTAESTDAPAQKVTTRG